MKAVVWLALWATSSTSCGQRLSDTFSPTEDELELVPDNPPQVQEEAGDGDVEPAQEAGDGDVAPALPSADFPADGEELVVVEASALRETQRQWDAVIRWTARRLEIMSQMRGMVDQLGTVISEDMQCANGLLQDLPKRPRTMGSGSVVNGSSGASSSARDGCASSPAGDGRACASSSANGTGSKRRISTGEFQYHVLAGNQRPRLRPAWMSVAEWNAFLAREEESDEDNGGDKDNGSRGGK